MFITTVHLLTSRNFLRELQTSIHIILTHQRHNFSALSTLGLKGKKKAFSSVSFKVWNEIPNEYKNLSKKSFKKETKRALLNILETEDSYMEPDEIMLKFKHNKIESNETSSTIFFVHLETLGLFLLYNNICHLPFFLFLFFFAYLFVLLCYISSFPFYFQCNWIKSVKNKLINKQIWPASISICYLRVKGISAVEWRHSWQMLKFQFSKSLWLEGNKENTLNAKNNKKDLNFLTI